MKILHPGIESDNQVAVRAPRVDDISAKSVILLDNSHFNVDTAMAELGRMLNDIHNVSPVYLKKENANSPAAVELLETAARSGVAVINGIAD